MVKTIKKGEIVGIEVEEEDTKVEKEETEAPKETEKAASPPTLDMVIARLDAIASKVTENSEALKAMKKPPKPPKEEDKEDVEKKTEDKTEGTDDSGVEKEEKKEEAPDLVALIKEVVKNEVSAKFDEQPIQKRSTAPAEPLKADTPMDIPPEIMAKADIESILKMGGYTMERK